MIALFLLALIVSGLVALWREFSAIDKSVSFDMPEEAISKLGDRLVGLTACVAGLAMVALTMGGV